MKTRCLLRFLLRIFQLHHHQPTKHQSSQFNHKMKKRHWFTCSSRNPKSNKTLLFQRPHQLNHPNQRSTSSSTKLKRNHKADTHHRLALVPVDWIWAHQDQLAVARALILAAAVAAAHMEDHHQLNTDLLANRDHTKSIHLVSLFCKYFSH